MDLKTEIWSGHEIRFVWHNNEWWAIVADVVKPLGLSNPTMAIKRVEKEDKALIIIEGLNRADEPVNIANEFGIYDLISTSRKKEAKDFKRWTKQILKYLRQSSGLEGFQIFRMLDKDHQKEAMNKLKASLQQPVRVDFIKANTIANKATSSKFGYPKMIKKDQMTPDMLVHRQQILDDTVNLMSVSEKFGLQVSVSELVYKKYLN